MSGKMKYLCSGFVNLPKSISRVPAIERVHIVIKIAVKRNGPLYGNTSNNA
ncbi:MAG: hypothetical protein WC194_11180 [Mesotoga sp.]|uniref:hypothetical protein n=1 Tax=Mesotoga sp. TaxID=2053577 RepID=UPI0035686432